MRQNNSENNRQTIGAIIASACIVIYAVALIMMTVRMYLSVDQHRTAAEQEFFEIADLASSAGVLGFMDEPFVKTINDALSSSGTLEGIIISGPYGEYAFEKEKGRAVNWVNNSPRPKKSFDLSSQPLFRPLQISGLRNATIQAVASAVNYRIISNILKQTLFLILIGLAVSLFSLVMETLMGKPAYKSDEDTGSVDSGAVKSTVLPESIEPIVSESEETRDDYFVDTAPGWPPSGEPAMAEPEPLPEMEIPAELPIEPVPEPVKEEKAEAVKVSAETVTEPVPAHRELYSPHGTICWEDNTVERLDAELRRCESFERDLAVIMMEYKYTDSLGDAFYDEFAAEVVRFFTSRDMVFEKGERGVTVIYPHADLETAFLKCDEFHELVMSKFPGAFKSKTSLCAGLSTRAGRLMDAKRLVFEASESLERALADPVSHIVAFKSDPDKFRTFIASRNKKRP